MTVDGIVRALRDLAETGLPVVGGGTLRRRLGCPPDFGAVLTEARRRQLIARKRVYVDGQRASFYALPENGHHLGRVCAELRETAER